MNMKANAESLGSGFYLSIILLLVAGVIWNLLEPRRIDSEMLAQITRISNPTSPEAESTVSADSLIPSAGLEDQAFAQELKTKVEQALSLNQNMPIVMAAILECSLQLERSLGQRFQCAALATSLDKDHSNKYRAQILGAKKKWPREIKAQVSTQF